MKKILYNKNFGGFGFSDELLEMLGIKGGPFGEEGMEFEEDLANRTNPEVIQAVELLGFERAGSSGASLAFFEAPDNALYHLKIDDGKETLMQVGSVQGSFLI